MTDEATRAAFEAWHVSHHNRGMLGRDTSGSYVWIAVADRWEAWQAATAQATAGMKDRLLAALERAAAAETSLHLQATAPLEAAIKKVHAAKGRHHNQIAMCDLYELVGLPCVRPDAIRKANHD